MKRRCRLLVGLLVLAVAGCTVPRLIDEGDELMAAKRPAAAVAKYEDALSRKASLADDAEFMAKLRRARALAAYEAAYDLAQDQQWDEAIAGFQDALAADPSLAEATQGLAWARKEGAKAHHRRALELADQGDLNAAIAELRRARELDPDNLDVQDALESLKDKKAKNLSKASRTYHTALDHAADRHWAQARDALDVAIAANPNHILARVARARAKARIADARKLHTDGRHMLADHRLRRAIAAGDAALGIWPTYSEAKDLRQTAQARLDQARTLARQARAHADAERWDEAAATAASSLAIYPYDPETESFYDATRSTAAAAHAAEGRKLLAQEDLEAAERAFLRALDHVPDLRDALDGLARADLTRGIAAQDDGLWGSARLWYAQAAAHLEEPPYSTRLAQAQAAILDRVRFALAVEVTGPDGSPTAQSTALRTALMKTLAQRRPEVVALDGAAPPLFGLAVQLDRLVVRDTVTHSEERVHHYTIARDVPNPEVPRLRDLLAGARQDLHHVRRLYHRPCPRCGRSGRIPCPACDASGTVRCRVCKGSGEVKGKPCQACKGTGTRPCPRCKGHKTLRCPRCHGHGNLGGIDRDDLRRHEREVRHYEWELRRAPAYVTKDFPAEWPYTVRRHERKGLIDVPVTLRDLRHGHDLHTQRVVRNVPYYDTERLHANPDIGLRPDPLTLPEPEQIGAQLTTSAASDIAQDALRIVLQTRADELAARATALDADDQPAQALEARVDRARILRPLDPKAADALLARLQAARRTVPHPNRSLGLQTRGVAVNGKPGARITAIADGTRAARSALRVGDILTHLDGQPIPGPASLRRALPRTGQVAKLTVRRDGREVTVFVP